MAHRESEFIDGKVCPKPTKARAVIVRDSREQHEPRWSDGIEECTAKLDFGDYSAVGLTDRLALEVKWSLDDLAACVGRERERFDTMLRGLRRYPMRALIVAASQGDVRNHSYTSAVRPAAVIASTWAWAMDYGVPTIWAVDAAGATRVVEWWVARALERKRREPDPIARARSAEPDLTGYKSPLANPNLQTEPKWW